MYTVDYVSLGKNIRKYRHEKHYTQEQLAERCFLSSGYIGDIERADRIPSLQVLLSICYELDVSPNRLLYESLPEDVFGELLDRPLKLRQPDRTLRNTLTNWYFADLPDESRMGEPPVTSEQLSRLQFTLLGDEMPFYFAEMFS
ncbi:MAG: helix-turn-helix transcriptional regulator [Clostridia bacterium]|nr:helix-turn-helix transcriptional regulator [Clostridia bacterium]